MKHADEIFVEFQVQTECQKDECNIEWASRKPDPTFRTREVDEHLVKDQSLTTVIREP